MHDAHQPRAMNGSQTFLHVYTHMHTHTPINEEVLRDWSKSTVHIPVKMVDFRESGRFLHHFFASCSFYTKRLKEIIQKINYPASTNQNFMVAFSCRTGVTERSIINDILLSKCIGDERLAK